MTEIGAASCCRLDDPAEIRYHTVGHALPDYEFRVAGGGEIEVSGPQVTRGYYRQPEQTEESFRDGWFRTGDLGTIDDGGRLRISGRAKEVVHVAGLSVFPAEVEGFLLTHPDIEQAVVVGVPHETMGEVLEAFIVIRSESTLTPPQILQFARPRIAGYKLPYAIHIVPDIPQLPSGKPDRLAIAEPEFRQRIAAIENERSEEDRADTGAGARATL
jgi:acyl-CoA synthetase (AMP-forming)/AMP-acid ligase II